MRENTALERRAAMLTMMCCLAVHGALAKAQQEARPFTVLEHHIEYAVVGGKSLRLDAHLPAGKGPSPAIVLLHGGGFTGGAKGGHTGELARHLAAHGCAAFDIDYRLMRDLGPGATLPQAMDAAREDLGRAMEHVVTKSRNYVIDPDRIAVGGGSASAITALLATYGRARAARSQSPEPARSGLASFSAPTEPADPAPGLHFGPENLVRRPFSS